jgi:hypothetical protein
VVVQPWPWDMLSAEISEPESYVRGGVMGDAGTTGARGEGVLPWRSSQRGRRTPVPGC